MNLFGGFLLTSEGTPVAEVNTERLQLLTAYLAMHRGAIQSRQHIAYLFWPDSREKQAYNNLRNVLHRLRNALPDYARFLQIDNKSLCWRDDAPFGLDVAEFEMHVARAKEARQKADSNAEKSALQAAARLYAGDFLSGFYDDWILPERERLRLMGVEAFERLIRLLEDQRAYTKALEVAHQLLRADPPREPTYRILMRLHALSGNRAGALQVYQQCLEMLGREFDLEPESQTHELYLQIQRGEEISQSRVSTAEDKSHEIPLIGRHGEWSRLKQAWQTAMAGSAALFTISGEAGIGKTRLMEELHTWVVGQGLAAARARCYAAEGRLAYAPVIAWLRSDELATHRKELDEVWRIELTRLLPELQTTRSDLTTLEPIQESRGRQRLFEALARVVLAGGRPLLLTLDDLQWCDTDTLEWLRFLMRFAPGAPFLVVSTLRSGEPVSQALQDLLLELGRQDQITELTLSPFSEQETTQLANRVADTRLPDSYVEWLYRETEGNPLFVVESVRAGVSSAESEPRHGITAHSDSPEHSLPTRVRAVLATRLSRLTAQARSLCSLAAAIGRSFSVDVLIRSSHLAEEVVVDALDELCAARIVRNYSGVDYDFTHDKLREAAYAELSSARKRLLHRRIAEVLEQVNAANPDAVSAQIAVHYDRAALPDQAIVFYARAASIARHMGSYRDAVQHYTRSLELLDDMPESERRNAKKQELLISLGLALRLTEGHASRAAGEVFEKARLLNDQIGGPVQKFTIQRSLWSFHLLRSDYRIAHTLAEELLKLADRLGDEGMRLEALVALGLTNLWQGDLFQACEFLEESLEFYDEEKHGEHVIRYGQDPGVASHSLLAYANCLLGRWNQSRDHLEAAISLAGILDHHFSLSYVLQHAMLVAHAARRNEETKVQAESLMRLSEERGYVYWLGPARIGLGWAVSEGGQPLRGIDSLRQGLAEHHSRGAALSSTLWQGMLVEALIRAGKYEEAFDLVDSALERVHETGEHIWESELLRLKGELLLDRGNDMDGAKTYLERALYTARTRKAKLLELRAATSLSRLAQGDADDLEGVDELRKVFDWFTSGFQERDLIDAKRVLDRQA